MQRACLALIGILLVIVNVLPTMAQGGSITSIIDNRSDLSTLKIFLDAADPSVRETLSGSGSFTMFAPNDVAFQNLSSLLDIPLQDLLQSPEIVTQLLQYHIINGSNDANAIAQRSGQVVPTQLLGAFLGIRLDDNGAVTINNVVEIEQANIRASNGIVHIVNDVLLNRIIAAAVDNANLESAITPNPFTGTETTTPEPTTEPTQTPDTIAVGNIRIAHFVPDADDVDVYINDTVLFSDIAFSDVSHFVSLQPGSYNIAFAPVNTSIESAILSPFGITIIDGEFITVAAIGSVKNDSVDIALLTEDYSELEDETSRFTVYNALEGDTAIDVLNGVDILLENVDYGATATTDVENGVYRPSVTVNNDADSVIIEPQRVVLRHSSYYFVALVGTSDAPELIITAMGTNTINELRSGSELITDDSSTASGDASNLNIMDTLAERGEFSILIAAIEGADDRIINRLGATIQEPVTLLAPTDRAFENLITTVGMTQEAFLRNTDIVTDILLYHLIEAEIFAADFRASAGTSVITMLPENQAFFVTVTDNGTVLLNGFVPFEQVDIRASNGVIHIIEDVLIPQSVANELGL
jgi:transforming growth factor-beta-induced protein